MKQFSLFDKHSINLADVKRSQAWFDAQMKSIGRISARSALSPGNGMLTATIVPGNMYCYFYDPITKDELPYYDTFPLVFPFSRTTETFHGLNLHYLNYPMRFALLKELVKISGQNLTPTKKLQFSWDTIKGISKMAPAQACVKQYRFDRIRSPLMMINPMDWATAALLPLQQFVGATDKHVWQESKRYRSW